MRDSLMEGSKQYLFVFLYFNQTNGVQQYVIDNVLLIQFKAKTPNNISLIPTLAFTPYVTSPNVLATSLNFNKNHNVLYLSLL